MPPEPVRVLLVDDEPLVRAGSRDVLAAQPDFVVVGEAGDGLAAVAAIETLQPDLLLLDVQMPGLDGFGVLAQLEPTNRPAVVFVTAYEQYALRAFDAHAIDYLLKPFDERRLLAALDRARTWLQRRGDGPPLDALLQSVHADRGRDRFVVKHGGRLRLVQAAEIRWIEARGNYVHLHTDDGAFLLRETLTMLAAQLPAERFLRVHRSAIVAIPEVQDLQRTKAGDYELRLRGGDVVPMSRAHKAAFVERWR
jgi:two-component system, LytTR family, response regulator